MIRTVFPSIIRSTRPYTQQQVYVKELRFLLPSKHNYPYESKVLKSIMFTLRRHVSTETCRLSVNIIDFNTLLSQG
jgi:hypothetical protein